MNVSEVPVAFWLSEQLRMQRDGEIETLGPTLRHEILALLLYHANSAVTVTKIISSVWPTSEATEDGVRSYISRIRQFLNGMDCQIATSPRRYILKIDPMRVDVPRFRRLLELAERADRSQKRLYIDEAMQVCPSDALLAGFTHPWVHTARQSFRTQWTAAALLRNRYLIEDREYERLLAALRREKADQSLNQRLAEDYIRALYHCGHAAEALAHIETLTARLAAAKITVQKRLRQLADLIERQDPVLESVATRAAAEGPVMLPPLTTRIEGRGAEMRAMDGHASDMDTVRVIGIYGSPGIGKTSLANAYAHRNRSRYPGGVLYANLNRSRAVGAADIDAVLESLLRSLGLNGDAIPADRAARISRYQELMRRRRALVVLDDVGTSEEVVPLLPTAPGSLAVVTSRNRLTALTARYGALAIVLGPINHSASVAILSRMARPRTDWAPAPVARIADACGGHPLALCLAGARLATRPEETIDSLAEVLTQTGKRIPTLDQFAERSEAVMDLMDLSYQGLDEPHARVFRLLGLSPRPALDLPAVAQLAGLPDDETERILTALVAAHLVTDPQGGRYGMLDLIHEYAAAVVTRVDGTSEAEAALDRLYRYWREMACAAGHVMWPLEVKAQSVDLAFPDSTAARAWLDDHRDDLVVLAQHPAATDRPDFTIDVANSLFRYLDHGGYLDDAVALLQAAADAARRTGDEAAAATQLGQLGAIHIRRGQTDRAESVLHEAYDLSVRLGDADGQATALGNLGRVAFRRGSYSEAIAYQSAALTIFRTLRDRLAEARTLTNLAIVCRARGDLGEALTHAQRAREICGELDAPDAAARASGTMAGVLRVQGQLEDAQRMYEEAITLFRELGDRVGEATGLSYLGLVHSDQRKHLEAIRLHEEALEIFEEIGDESACIDTLLNLGSSMLSASKVTRALAAYAAALDRAKILGDEGQVARAHAGLAEGYHVRAASSSPDSGALALARSHIGEALDSYRRLGMEPPARVIQLASATED